MTNPESAYNNERLVSIYDKQQLAPEQSLVYRLRERARIRRQIPGRKSVQEGKPDRIADLLEEAANSLEAQTRSDPLDGPMIKMFRD